MHIDIDDGDNSLYMFDENGEAVVLAELHGHHPREFAHIVKCVNHHDELVAALDELVTFADISVTAHDSDLISAIANARHYLAKVQS